MLPQMAEQNSKGRGMSDTASSSNPRPSRAVITYHILIQIALEVYDFGALEVEHLRRIILAYDGNEALLELDDKATSPLLSGEAN